MLQRVLYKEKFGGKRLICAPYSDLKHIQHWIYKNILLRDMKSVSPYGEGFVPKSSGNVRNIVSNAKRHVGCKWLINVDIQNFLIPSRRMLYGIILKILDMKRK